MYKINIAVLLVLLTANLLAADKEHTEPKLIWLTDFEQALKESKESQKPILIAFTGSDWCHACMRLAKEQFENDSFINFVMDNFVPVQVDFPRSEKKKHSPGQTAQNERLAEKYNPDGVLPLLVIVGGNEEAIGRTGYQKWSSGDFINHLKSLMK